MPAKGGPVEDKEDEDSVGKEEAVALAAVCAGGLATLWFLKRLFFRSKKPASRPAAVSAAAAASAPGPIARDAVSRWTVRGVTDFLNGLGLGRYAPAFTDAAVDGQLLLQLTTEDLVELGVSKRVHRKKIRLRLGLPLDEDDGASSLASGSVIDAVEQWRLTGKVGGGGPSFVRRASSAAGASPGGIRDGGDLFSPPPAPRSFYGGFGGGRIGIASTVHEGDEDEGEEQENHRGRGGGREEDYTQDALEARRGSSPPPGAGASTSRDPDGAEAKAAAAIAARKAAEAQRAAEEIARRQNEASMEREKAEQKRLIREARDKARAEAHAVTQVALDDAKRMAQIEAQKHAEMERKRAADAAFAALVEAQRRESMNAAAAAAAERDAAELARREAERARQAAWEEARKKEREEKQRAQEMEAAAAAVRRQTEAEAARERREQLARLQTGAPGSQDALDALAAAKAKAAQMKGAFDAVFDAAADQDDAHQLRAVIARSGAQARPPAGEARPPPSPTLRPRTPASENGSGASSPRLAPASPRVQTRQPAGPPPLSLSTPSSPRSVPERYAVACVGADTRLLLWTVPRLGMPASAAPVSVKQGHTDEVKAVCVLSDGCLATGGRDSELRVWPRSGGCFASDCAGGAIFGIAPLPGGGCVTACRDTTLRMWTRAPGDEGEVPSDGLVCTRTLSGHKNMVFAVDVTADGIRLVSGSADKTARLWRLDSSTDSAGEQLKSVRTLSGHTAWVNAVKLYDGATRCATGAADGTVRFWRCASGECLMTCIPQVSGSGPSSSSSSVLALAVVPDARCIAACYESGRLCVWNDDDGSLHSRADDAHQDAARAVICLPDGRLATAGDDRVVRLWRLDRGSLVPNGTLLGDVTSDSIFALAQC